MKVILHQTKAVYYDRMYIFLLTDHINNIIVEKRYNYEGARINYTRHTNILKEYYETGTRL